jgi:hypothetical protein
MKLLTSLLALTLVSTATFAQGDQLYKLKALENSDTIKTIVTDTTKIKPEPKADLQLSQKDTTRIRFGKKEIMIIEKNGTTSIEIPKDGDRYTFDSDKDRDFTYKKHSRFKGNWAGFEWGFNGLVNNDYSNNPADLGFMSLRQERSWNFNLNFMQYSLGFGTDKVGLVTGLGLEYNNYHFRNLNSIKLNDLGIVVEDDSYITEVGRRVTSSRLSTSHLTLPLLLEFQIPTGRRNRIFISGGVIGGVRLSSYTKVEWDKPKEGVDKVKDPFNLSSFRYGYTARVGFKGLSLFATYYPTDLFEKNMGPDVNSFAIGLRLLNFSGN